MLRILRETFDEERHSKERGVYKTFNGEEVVFIAGF